MKLGDMVAVALHRTQTVLFGELIQINGQRAIIRAGRFYVTRSICDIYEVRKGYPESKRSIQRKLHLRHKTRRRRENKCL